MRKGFMPVSHRYPAPFNEKLVGSCIMQHEAQCHNHALVTLSTSGPHTAR